LASYFIGLKWCVFSVSSPAGQPTSLFFLF
jgi:hypothetical protein